MEKNVLPKRALGGHKRPAGGRTQHRQLSIFANKESKTKLMPGEICPGRHNGGTPRATRRRHPAPWTCVFETTRQKEERESSGSSGPPWPAARLSI